MFYNLGVEALLPGEIVYTGSRINQYPIEHNANIADYCLRLYTNLHPGAIVEVRARRGDNGHYVSMVADASTNTCSIREYDGTLHTSKCVSYFFNQIPALYEVGIACLGNAVFGIINGNVVVCAVSYLNTAEYGYSLAVEQIPEAQRVKFYRVTVRPTAAWHEKTLEDSTALPDVLRRQILDEVESPDGLSWTKFKEDDKLLRWMRGNGRSEDEWELLGYPRKRITTERYENPPGPDCPVSSSSSRSA